LKTFSTCKLCVIGPLNVAPQGFEAWQTDEHSELLPTSPFTSNAFNKSDKLVQSDDCSLLTREEEKYLVIRIISVYFLSCCTYNIMAKAHINLACV
jgi:hypothetical protein